MKNLIIAPVLVLHLIIFEAGQGRPGNNLDDSIKKDYSPQTTKRRVARDVNYEDMEYDDYDDEIIDERLSFSKQQLLPPDLPVDTILDSEGFVLNSSIREPPEYMLDLYNQFSRGYTYPSSNIVRSFMNINDEDTPLMMHSDRDQLSGQKTRIHTLVFNITSISTEEDIKLAELRLYTLVERDRWTYIGVDRIVSVYEVSLSGDSHGYIYSKICSKHIYGRDSGWEMFDVTSAVIRWINNLSSLQILEIRIESVFMGVSQGDMDINTAPRNRKEPLLVIFSNDYSGEKLHEQERHELATHELDSYKMRSPGLASNTLTQMSNRAGGGLRRIRRSRFRRSRGSRKNVCKKMPMYVNFEDINWHTWILAPRGYQAYECRGRCYFPLSDHLTPTKHAIIRTLVHTNYPKKASRACCVPTKLDAISILYIDDKGVITYKYKYDGMVVSECGCR